MFKLNGMFLPTWGMKYEKDEVTSPEPASKPGGGGEPNPVDPPKDTTYELKIDGQTRSVTLDEMKDLAMKSGGADKRFQDASELKKEAENGLRIASLVDSLNKSENFSEPEARELAALLGIDGNEFVEESLKAKDEFTEDTPRTTTKGKLSKDDLAAGLKELGLDPATVKGILDYSHQRHIDAARSEIRKISDGAVDKDEVFAKMIVGEKGEDRLAVIKELVAEDILRKIQDGVPFGADMVAASAQKVRAHLTKFGIPGKPAQYPVVLGLGPGAGLPAEVQAEEPIKRISAAEDGDEQNIIARYLQRAIQGGRKAQG